MKAKVLAVVIELVPVVILAAAFGVGLACLALAIRAFLGGLW